MRKRTATSHHLELRVHELAQLFNSMDPTPFHSKALDCEAETFIESWARGFSPKNPLHLTIHLQHMPLEGDPTALVTGAIHHHFADKADLVRRDLRDIFWQARISLLIGLTFVAVCLLLAEAIGQAGASSAHTSGRPDRARCAPDCRRAARFWPCPALSANAAHTHTPATKASG